MTGLDLKTFATGINGGDPIGDTLLAQYFNIAKALVEQRRPWMILRKTDTSVVVSTGNTWQTGISLSGIARFNRFYGEWPIRLFNGVQTYVKYRQVPFEERLAFINSGDTFCYDESTQTLYLNGLIPFAGTLYISIIQDTPAATVAADWTWSFPSFAHPLIGLMAVSINKGGVDFDDINRLMAPDNRAMAEQITKMLENWDNEKQLSATTQYDRDESSYGPRPNAIQM